MVASEGTRVAQSNVATFSKYVPFPLAPKYSGTCLPVAELIVNCNVICCCRCCSCCVVVAAVAAAAVMIIP